jgi:hypothetical protein
VADQSLELGGEIVVDRDRDALHGVSRQPLPFCHSSVERSPDYALQ